MDTLPIWGAFLNNQPESQTAKWAVMLTGQTDRHFRYLKAFKIFLPTIKLISILLVLSSIDNLSDDGLVGRQMINRTVRE
jgi:hypothetical protein